MTNLLFILLGVYVVAMSVFLVSENRRPQATLAWLLAFFFLPILGGLIYLFFGRDWKAFSKRTRLLKQDLEPDAFPLLSQLLTDQDAEIERLLGASPGHRKLMMLVRRSSRSVLTSRNRVEIQQDAATFYPNMIRDIEGARHSIHLQYYIWAADSFTEELGSILCDKARDGIEVRLLYDPQGSHASLSRSCIARMRNAGVQMAPTSRLYPLHTIGYRNHRKITVVDGTIGYTGGMNIGQEHLHGGKGFDAWRDTQVRIVGEGAAALQTVFLVDWYNAVRENLFAPVYFPMLHPQAPEATHEGSGHAPGGTPQVSEGTGQVPGPGEPAAVAADPGRTGEVADVPVQVITSGPDSQWAGIEQLYSLMIVGAQRHVYLQSPYFILTAAMVEARRTAALAGVDVRVMLSARASGNRLPGWAGNTYIAEVVAAGVRVYLYDRGYLHAKTVSIDSQICSIGSANVDIRSFSINYELNAVLYSDRLAGELEATFHEDLAHCREFDPAEYRSRGFPLRFRDSVARLFSPLL